MQAVILVGGEGTRLRPLTLTTPKQMLPLMGIPMLEGVLGHLGAHGVDEAVLSLGYLPDRFLDAYPDGICAGVNLRYAVEPEPLDTAGAVRFAAEELGVDDTFIVVNGDVLTDLDLSALVHFHHERGAEGTIAVHPVEDPSRFGVVPTDAHGRVEAFVEKPPADEAPTNLINAGTYVFEPAALHRIPLGERVSIERVTFPAMVTDGVLFAFADERYWLDAGTPEAYLQAHRDILEGRRTPAYLRHVVVNGSSIDPSARVHETATVVGSVIDADCLVGPGAEVIDSVLLPGARVEAAASVRSSILGRGSSVEIGAQVGEISVLGDGAVVLPGEVIAAGRIGV